MHREYPPALVSLVAAVADLLFNSWLKKVQKNEEDVLLFKPNLTINRAIKSLTKD